jgi:hypothetical protein
LRWRLELRHLIQVFREQRIDLIVLKGAVLSAIAYPDTCLRSMTDIDLLVRPEDAERALRLTEAAGFRCPERYRHLQHHRVASQSRPEGAEESIPLQKAGTRAFVEVHTQLESAEPRYPMATQELWSRAEEFDWSGLPCKTLERHEFLLHLIMHLAEHHLFEHGLRALLDVHLWIELQRERLDWNWLTQEAARRGCAQWVHLSLRMVRDALATPIPAAVFARLEAPRQLQHVQRLAWEQIFAEGRVVGNIPKLVILALAQPDWVQAARLVVRRIIPSRAAVPAEQVRTVIRSQAPGFGLVIRRVLSDLRTRLPQYYRAWRAGRLRWGSLRRAATLERRARQIRDLMQSQTRRRRLFPVD